MKIWTGGSDVSPCSSDFIDRIVPDLEDHIAAFPASQNSSEIVDLTNDHEQLVGDSQSVVAAQPFGEFLLDAEAPLPRPFSFSDPEMDGEMFNDEFSDLQPANVSGDTPVVSVDIAVPADQFDRVLQEAHMANMRGTGPSLPWESGVFSSIFGEQVDIISSTSHDTPFPPAMVEPKEESKFELSTGELGLLKRPAESRIYVGVVKSISDTDFFQQRDNLWEIALNKWLLIFSCINYSGCVGERLLTSIWTNGGDSTHKDILRDVVGIKSPKTVNERANTIIALFNWLDAQHGFRWPLNVSEVVRYVEHPHHGRVAPNRGKSLMEAFRFAKFVMRVESLDGILDDPQLTGKVKRLGATATTPKQARALTVAELQKLEQFMVEQNDDRDKYIMGCVLFCVFSRSRWSDLAMLDKLTLDISEMPGGECYGFVESCTRFQKTGTSAIKKTLQMPLVAPIAGVTQVAWAQVWFEILRSVGFDLDAEPIGALCRAPQEGGVLSKRSLTTDEVTGFVNAVLELEGSSMITSHSFKSTTLIWAARYGMEEPLRCLLGHHEVPGRSMATYSRDLLARPLAEFQGMLRNIRLNNFKPDLSRSGWKMGDAGITATDAGAKGDDIPSQTSVQTYDRERDQQYPRASSRASAIQSEEDDWERVEEAEASEADKKRNDEEVVSLSGSESSTSSSETSSANEEVLQKKCGSMAIQPDITIECFQHKKSRVLHKPQTDKSVFVCGRRNGPTYSHLPDGASFKWPRCSGCFKGEVITTRDGLADALDRVRAKRMEAKELL